LIELIKHAPSNVDLLAAFTVQEELGLRGARVAAYALDPDLAIAIDSTPANDLPVWDGSENTFYNTRLDAGPALYIADSTTLSDPRLVRHLAQTGDALGIPYQFRQPGGGGTDAGAIHKQRAGVPSVSVSVPGRYAHTAAGMARLQDWKNTLLLLHAALERLPADILAVER
jgi:endoglucanase